MLNINGLCIGDWLSYINRKCRVIHIDDNGTVYAECRDFSMPRIVKHIDHFEPIKITREIIKPSLNRLKWTDTGVYWVIEIDDYFVEYYPDTGVFIKYTYIVDENNDYIQHIVLLQNCYYIHELQHAMRLAGLSAREKDIIFYE